MASYILAIDQGTTSSRAILFDREGHSVASAQREFPQHFPHDGWIEHDPEDIWDTVLATCREVIAKTGIGLEEIAGVGITNQRETTVLWDRDTGEALHHAIVWQDRRTDEAVWSWTPTSPGPRRRGSWTNWIPNGFAAAAGSWPWAPWTAS